MKNIYLTLLSCLLFFSCIKDSGNKETPRVPGGKGGNFNIAVFPKNGNTGITSKVYIKYGTVDKPASLSLFDDSAATMVEPGYGPHAHFFSLKPGYYAIKAIGVSGTETLSGDTILTILDTQAISLDYDIYVHK